MIIPVYSSDDMKSYKLDDKDVCLCNVFQVTALTAGVIVPVYCRDGLKTCKLDDKDVCHFPYVSKFADLDGRIVNISLWRLGITIILTGECVHNLEKENTDVHVSQKPVNRKEFNPCEQDS